MICNIKQSDYTARQGFSSQSPPLNGSIDPKLKSEFLVKVLALPEALLLDNKKIQVNL